MGINPVSQMRPCAIVIITDEVLTDEVLTDEVLTETWRWTLKRVSRALIVVVTFGAVLAPVADASSYTSSAAFNTYLRGATRSYVGANISINLTGVTCSRCNVNSYFVSLWRNVGGGSDNRIGTVTCQRSANCLRTWTNVGTGSYDFVFERANDGGEQRIANVSMYN